MVDENIIKKWMQEDGGTILYDPLHPGVFTGYVRFTPERAASALENNTHNRKMGDNRQIPPLMDAIIKGYWDDNVAKLNFAKVGWISDGQNRLKSCVRTNTSIRCLVTWGVEESAQLVTDRRGNRTLSNDLSINGFKNANSLAAITRVLYLLDNGATARQLINKGITLASAPDIVTYNYFCQNADRCIETTKLVGRMQNSVRDLRINGSTMNVLVYEFDRINELDALNFWERLSSGIAECEDDPIIALRMKLADNAKSKLNKMPNSVVAALIIKAWNYYMAGETVKQLKFRAGGANPEEFPEIYNPYVEESA